MREISGEITKVEGFSNAGNWKHKDLPLPVPMLMSLMQRRALAARAPRKHVRFSAAKGYIVFNLIAMASDLIAMASNQ